MKKKSIVSLLVSTLILVGCGSGSGGGDSDTDERLEPSTNSEVSNSESIPDTNSVDSWQAVTNNITCDPDIAIVNSMHIDSTYASQGDILGECILTGGLKVIHYKLINNINSLTVSQVLKSDYIDIRADEGTIKAVQIYNYKEGTIRYIGDYFSERKVDCIEVHPSILTSTISGSKSINDLLLWERDDRDMVSTTCPKSWYEDDTNNFDFVGTWNTNYTIIDSNGKKHLLSEESIIK